MSTKNTTTNNTQKHLEPSSKNRSLTRGLRERMRTLLIWSRRGWARLTEKPWQGPAVAGENSFDTSSLGGMDSILKALSSNFKPGMFTGIAEEAASGRLLDPATNPTLQPND